MVLQIARGEASLQSRNSQQPTIKIVLAHPDRGFIAQVLRKLSAYRSAMRIVTDPTKILDEVSSLKPGVVILAEDFLDGDMSLLRALNARVPKPTVLIISEDHPLHADKAWKLSSWGAAGVFGSREFLFGGVLRDLANDQFNR